MGDMLPYNFKILRFFGLYSDSSGGHHPRKKFGFYLTMFSYAYFLSGEAGLGLFDSSGSVEEITEVLLIFLVVSTGWAKTLNIIRKGKYLRLIVRDFGKSICRPVTAAELEAYDRSKKWASGIFAIIMSWCTITGVVILLTPFFSKKTEMALPYKVYDFFDISKPSRYWPTYVVQFVTSCCCASTQVCLDTLVNGLFILVAGQFEVLALRFSKLGKSDKVSINECIKHHFLLQDIVKNIERSFIGTTVYYFSVIIVILCSCIFQVSQVRVN